VLAVGVKTLSTWTNHLFETPLDEETYATRKWAYVPDGGEQLFLSVKTVSTRRDRSSVSVIAFL
jgi:hypothetical protein